MSGFFSHRLLFFLFSLVVGVVVDVADNFKLPIGGETYQLSVGILYAE